MESVNLSVKLVNEIMGYLGGRPFAEVVTLINGVQSEVASQLQAQDAPADEAK